MRDREAGAIVGWAVTPDFLRKCSEEVVPGVSQPLSPAQPLEHSVLRHRRGSSPLGSHLAC